MPLPTKIERISKRIALLFPPLKRLYTRANEPSAKAVRVEEILSLFRPSSEIVQPATEITCVPSDKADDSSLVARVTKAYRRLDKEPGNYGESMWQVFFYAHHKEIHKIFMNGKISKVAAILRDPSSTNLFYGFDSLCASSIQNCTTLKAREEMSLLCLAGLIRFCEAAGSIRLYNPESNNQQRRLDVATVIEHIEKILGTTLTFPNPYPNELGLKTPHGVASYRAVQAVYQAWRIKELAKHIRNPRVLEIGAGLGRTAYYARKLGIVDYTVIDIPITSISQGYFLGRTLGEDAVLLSGETAPDAASRIKVFFPNVFLKGNATYYLIINVDSLTEMDPVIARAYWARIQSLTDIFLSINHEDNPFTVREFIDASAKVMSAERQDFWMRRGYVEEVVRFKAGA